MNINSKRTSYVKQRGATLFTALTFLLLMTVVTVTASKISIQDTYIANNTQQKQLLFQQTENDLAELTTVIELYVPLTGEGGAEFNDLTGIYKLPLETEKLGTVQAITDLDKRYQCGGFNGKAISIGPDTNHCFLYDFRVGSRAQNTGARDRHNRGAGKEKPNPGKHSYLSFDN